MGISNAAILPKWAWVRKLSLRSTTTQLLLVLLGVFALGPLLPTFSKMGLYTLSLCIKEVLTLLLPIVVFSCLFKTLLANKAYAFRFVGILLFMVVASNVLSIIVGYGASHMVLPYLDLANINQGNPAQWSEANTLLPLANISFNPWEIRAWFNNQHALLAGLVLGLTAALLPVPQQLNTAAERLQQGVHFFLTRLFIPILPLFILGFVLKMQHEGKLSLIYKCYIPIVLLIAVTNTAYIAALYGIAAKCNLRDMSRAIKNMLPAGLAGMTTMSSIAALPITLQSAENNVSEEDKATVQAVIPATVNIHLIGDSIAITIMALAMLLAFGHDLPTASQFWHFVQLFVITKFSVATIPGGSILAMLPVLEHTLGFSSEMLGFITAVYILFDPLITAMNVVGNGAFALFSTACLPKQKNMPIDKPGPER